MSSVRQGMPGATRDCPHCRETILESAAVCPSCRHHIRFDSNEVEPDPLAMTPLRIEGSFRQPAESGACEYSVIVTIRDERGVEVGRKLIGVGALGANEQRSFTLLVEMSPSKGKSRGLRH
jgi:hypothetical protein